MSSASSLVGGRRRDSARGLRIGAPVNRLEGGIPRRQGPLGCSTAMKRLWLHDALLADPEAPARVAGLAAPRGLGASPRGSARADPHRPMREPITLGGARLAPGLIDIHFHGELATCADR